MSTVTTRSHDYSSIRLEVRMGAGPIFFFFVDTDLGERWAPWWDQLYALLASLASGDLEWKYEPVQGHWYARLALTSENKEAIARELRRAPASEATEHRALRKTLRELAEGGELVGVVFYKSGSPPCESSTDGGSGDRSRVP
jgi:hypothetical protein